MHVTRVLWLLALFTPVIMCAPVALSWNMGRAEWMRLLRMTLESAGGPLPDCCRPRRGCSRRCC